MMAANAMAFACRCWTSPKSCTVFIFTGGGISKKELTALKEESKRYRVSNANVENVIELAGTLYDTDRTDTMLQKLLYHGQKSQTNVLNDLNIDDLYGWVYRKATSHDLDDIYSAISGHDELITGSQLNRIRDIYFKYGKRSEYAVDTVYSLEATMNELRLLSNDDICVPLDLVFKHSEMDRLLSIPPIPWDWDSSKDWDGVNVRRVYRRALLLRTIAAHRNIIDIALRGAVENSESVYFGQRVEVSVKDAMEAIIDTDDALGRMNKVLSDTVVNTTVNRIESLLFRVQPNYTFGNTILDIAMIFRTLPTTVFVPVLVYLGTNTTSYRISREHVNNLDVEYLNRIEKYEMANAGNLIQRNQESLVLIMNVNEIIFQVIVASSGSYRVSFKFSRQQCATYEDVNKCFAEIGKHVLMIHPKLTVLTDTTNIYDDDLIELIEQIVNVKMLLNSTVVDNGQFLSAIESVHNIFDVEDASNTVIKYKRVDNFKNVDAITAYLMRNSRLNNDELVRKVAHDFNLSISQAEREVDTKRGIIAPMIRRRGRRFFATERFDPGMIARVHLKKEGIIRARITSSANPIYVSYMMAALVACATKPKQVKSSKLLLERHTVNDSDDEACETAEDLNINDVLRMMREMQMESADVEDNVIPDLTDAIIDIESDVESILDDPENVVSENEVLMDDVAITTEHYTNFVLNKLFEADPKLFSRYSRSCGKSDFRQPVVITADEKRFIDSNYPRSYNGYVQTGSTPEKSRENFYICPKIWCRLGRVSVESSDLVNGRCPTKYNELPLYFPPAGVTNYFIDKKGNEVHLPMLMDSSLHPNGLRMPCCGKKSSGLRKPPVTTRYISKASSNKVLALRKLGALPNCLKTKFPINISHCIGTVPKGSECISRMGMDTSRSDTIEQCLQYILGVQDICLHISKYLKIQDYLVLNAGYTLRVFCSPTDWKRVYEKPVLLQEFVEFLEVSPDYVRIFDLSDVVYDVMNGVSDLNNIKSWKPMMKTQREINIYVSFTRYKTYLLTERFVKTAEDLLHACTFQSINPNNYGILVLQCIDDDVYVTNPLHYDISEEIKSCEKFGLIYRIGTSYEILTRMHDSSTADPLFPRSYVNAFISSLPKTSVLPTHNPGDRMVIGHDYKWYGHLRPSGEYEAFTKPIRIPSNFIRDDTRIVYTSMIDSKTYVDALLFVSDGVGQVNVLNGGERLLYEIARKIASIDKAKKDIGILTHALNPMSLSDRSLIVRNILADVLDLKKFSDKQLDDFSTVFALQPLSFLLEEEERMLMRDKTNDIFLSKSDVEKGMLTKIYVMLENTLRQWNTSAADRVQLINVGELQHTSNKQDASRVLFLKNVSFVEIVPRRLGKIFPNLEIRDVEITLRDLVYIVSDNRISYEKFVDAAVEKSQQVLGKGVKELTNWFMLNPSFQSVDKRFPLEDYRDKLEGGDAYMFSFNEIDICARLSNTRILVLGRESDILVNGWKIFGDNMAGEMFALHCRRRTNPRAHEFRFVQSSRETFRVSTIVPQE